MAKKNIKNFCGKPIILWSIEEAIKSKCFEKIIVSTDDEEIANLVKSHGVDVPFVRPKELSDDYTETIPELHMQLNNIQKFINLQLTFAAFMLLHLL